MAFYDIAELEREVNSAAPTGPTVEAVLRASGQRLPLEVWEDISSNAFLAVRPLASSKPRERRLGCRALHPRQR